MSVPFLQRSLLKRSFKCHAQGKVPLISMKSTFSLLFWHKILIPNFRCYCHEGLCMSQHRGSHKNSLNLLCEKYLNESHWPMRRIRLLDCTTDSGRAFHWTMARGKNEYFWKFREECHWVANSWKPGFGLDIFWHGNCHKPIYDAIEEIKMGICPSLFQCPPVEILQHCSDTGPSVVITGGPSCTSALYFLYLEYIFLSGDPMRGQHSPVGGHTKVL